MTSLLIRGGTVFHADPVPWDPQATHTVSQGRVVWADGDLPAVPGAGRSVKRPAFGPHFQAAAKRMADLAPSAVAR